MYNIYLWPQLASFTSPMFVSEPDPKLHGSEDKRWGLAVKWWGFFFFHCCHPSSSPHHFPPFKSVTHYMSGQRGGWNQILFASPSLTWISLGPTVTAQRERERERRGRRGVQKNWEEERGRLRGRNEERGSWVELFKCVWWWKHLSWRRDWENRRKYKSNHKHVVCYPWFTISTKLQNCKDDQVSKLLI